MSQNKVKMYKLVTSDWTTHNGMTWEIGKTNRAKEEGNEMCTGQVLHCYSDPYLAVIFNPVHANIKNPILLEIECSKIINTDGCKFACKEQTPVKQIEVPKLTTKQLATFAIKSALLVYKATDFVQWAESWLSGLDTSSVAADDAAYAAYADDAARAAARAAAYADDDDAADAAAYAAAYAAAAVSGNIDFKSIIEFILSN